MNGSRAGGCGVAVGPPAAGRPQRIGFKRHLHTEVVAGEAAYLISERGVTALEGELAVALTPLLDGTRDLAAVVREMPPGTAPDEVHGLVTDLVAAGLVGPTDPVGPGADPAALAYWDAAGLCPTGAVSDLSTARIALIAVGGVDSVSAAATAALSAAGLTVAAGTSIDGDLSVVLCPDYLAPELAEVDTAHRAAGRPWLLAKPGGTTPWLGPIFRPDEPGCWHCLAGRLTAHRQAERYLQAALGRRGPAPRSAVSLTPLAGAALNLVALEATKWLAGYRYPGQRCVWTFDSLGLSGRHHELRGRPQCPTCGDSTLVRTQVRRPVTLQPRRTASRQGGGHRAVPPEQVLDRYRHLVSPVTGVIKEISRDTRGPASLNVYRSGPNSALTARSLHALRSALRMENSGKGATPLEAEVGALCEALERYCGTYQGDEARVRGSLRQLGEQAVHPNQCLLFDERQYAGRAGWNRAHSAFQQVFAPFDELAKVNWTPVWSLTEQRHRLLPTALLYFGAPAGPGPAFAYADSNGNAAGSTLEDAVLQGLLEVVERDAVALWWYNRMQAPGVDLDAFADPWIEELRAVYADLGREIWALDVTSDLRVPTMVALSRWPGGRREGIMFGFGAHLDPRVALRRALSEMNQMLPAIVEIGPDGEYGWDDDPDASRWFQHATLADQPYLAADPQLPAWRPADYGYQPSDDLTRDVRTVQARLEGLGMQVLLLDQTRPDIGLPVVKVIVPGMRHFWARFGPGRLYDVPVQQGRLPAPTPYEQLNPIPLFL